MKIIILCTGNSCRSQMAEAFLKLYDKNLEVNSAGTEPSEKVHPKAIKVMAEAGIDISGNSTKPADEFVSRSFDYVITVCDNAREHCPVFTGEVKHSLHIRFDDPAEATGTEEEIYAEYRRIRDEIRESFYALYHEIIKK